MRIEIGCFIVCHWKLFNTKNLYSASQSKILIQLDNFIGFCWCLKLAAPFHSSAEQHDNDSGSRLHAAPPEQHAAQPPGNQHHQHPQRECEFQQYCRKEIRLLMLIGTTFNFHQICFSDVSILHEWAALSRIPVSDLSLPAYTPAGVLFNPNWTTGTMWKLTVWFDQHWEGSFYVYPDCVTLRRLKDVCQEMKIT